MDDAAEQDGLELPERQAAFFLVIRKIRAPFQIFPCHYPCTFQVRFKEPLYGVKKLLHDALFIRPVCFQVDDFYPKLRKLPESISGIITPPVRHDAPRQSGRPFIPCNLYAKLMAVAFLVRNGIYNQRLQAVFPALPAKAVPKAQV